jgi:hypothetical protein
VLGRIQSAQQAWANELGALIGAGDLAKATDVLTRVLSALGSVGAT